MPTSSNQNIAFENLPDFHVLIVAAGSGARFGGNIPKQYIQIHRKTVLEHAITPFLNMPSCQSVNVVINPNDANQYHDAVKNLEISEYIEGSNERNLSVYNGLKNLSNLKNKDIILIHDAARPCVHPTDIAKLLTAMQNTPAATLATPVSSTLRKEDDEHNLQNQVNRENLWALQTPQAFIYGDIIRAHENNNLHNITDDTALVSALGIAVKRVEGSPSNIKITHPSDLDMAEQLLKPHIQTRTGMGFDVHAFDTDTRGPARLCGVDVPHDHKLKGHSDADVGLHTITDAILGAIGEGDIGRHFPPSDNTFKNMDSAIFLEKTMDMLRDKNATLTNIDLTIICEAPKIGPHAQIMAQRVAEICEIAPDQINIKATTTEKLGFTGRGEGIAAQAIATVEIPRS